MVVDADGGRLRAVGVRPALPQYIDLVPVSQQPDFSCKKFGQRNSETSKVHAAKNSIAESSNFTQQTS